MLPTVLPSFIHTIGFFDCGKSPELHSTTKGSQIDFSLKLGMISLDKTKIVERTWGA